MAQLQSLDLRLSGGVPADRRHALRLLQLRIAGSDAFPLTSNAVVEKAITRLRRAEKATQNFAGSPAGIERDVISRFTHKQSRVSARD